MQRHKADVKKDMKKRGLKSPSPRFLFGHLDW
jgi:hypothetical protein